MKKLKQEQGSHEVSLSHVKKSKEVQEEINTRHKLANFLSNLRLFNNLLSPIEETFTESQINMSAGDTTGSRSSIILNLTVGEQERKEIFQKLTKGLLWTNEVPCLLVKIPCTNPFQVKWTLEAIWQKMLENAQKIKEDPMTEMLKKSVKFHSVILDETVLAGATVDFPGFSLLCDIFAKSWKKYMSNVKISTDFSLKVKKDFSLFHNPSQETPTILQGLGAGANVNLTLKSNVGKGLRSMAREKCDDLPWAAFKILSQKNFKININMDEADLELFIERDKVKQVETFLSTVPLVGINAMVTELLKEFSKEILEKTGR